MRGTEYRWAQARVGLLIALVGVAVFAAIVYVGLAGTPLARRAHVVAHFDDVAGLAVGSPVEMGGVVVGEVSQVDLPEVETGKVPVTLAIEHRALERLGPSSLAYSGSHALVGQRFVGLTTRKPDEPPLKEGDTVQTRSERAMDAVLMSATAALDELRQLIQTIQPVAQAAATVAQRMENGQGTLGRLVSDDDALYADLSAAAGNLRQMTDQARRGDGALAMLMNDRQLARDIKQGVGALASTAQRLDRGEGVLGTLMRDDKAAQQLSVTLANLSLVSQRLAEAEGTLGALISDPALLSRMNALIVEMDALVADVRRNPGRYLKVEPF